MTDSCARTRRPSPSASARALRTEPARRAGLSARVGMLALVLLLAGCGPIDPDAEEVRYRSGGDLIAAGQVVVVEDTVDGDVMLAGRSIQFEGAAEGSYLGVAATQEIVGLVGGSARAAAGGLLLRGEVARNVTLFGAEVRLHEDAVVRRNAYLIGGYLEQQGAVEGHLRMAGREVVINGPVTGNVDVMAGSLTLGPFARIGGNLTYRVTEPIHVEPTARVEGEMVAIAVPEPSPVPGVVFAFLRILAFLLVGALAVLLFRRPLEQAARGMDGRPWPALGLGLLWLIATPVIVAATAVTVIGIPLAVILALAFAVGLYVAPVIPSLWLGRALLDRPGEEPTPAVRAFLVGGVIVGVTLLLPWIGFAARVLATALAFGGAVLAIRGSLAEEPETTAWGP